MLPDSREMLTQLLLFVSQTLVSFFTALLLFRFYCQLIKLNLKWIGGNIGLFVFKVTDWLVLPLKKIIPAIKNIDLSSLTAAYVVLCLYSFLKYLLITGNFSDAGIFVSTCFELISACISGVTGMIFVSALLSWFSANEQMKNLFEVLVTPLLKPFRAFIPMIAGVDISPLAALLFLQVLNILIQGIRVQLMV